MPDIQSKSINNSKKKPRGKTTKIKEKNPLKTDNHWCLWFKIIVIKIRLYDGRQLFLCEIDLVNIYNKIDEDKVISYEFFLISLINWRC